MNDQKRKQILNDFKNNDSVRILLISIKVGGVGLNLTSASIVIMLEPWWNPAIENQAIDRINRIGQKKEMKVFRFVTKNTIEERICAIREEKSQLFKMAIDDISKVDENDLDEEKADHLNANRLRFLLNIK